MNVNFKNVINNWLKPAPSSFSPLVHDFDIIALLIDSTNDENLSILNIKIDTGCQDTGCHIYKKKTQGVIKK